ncbi:MAG: replication-relaxation family protein [Planctomycetaceae bacterium]
MKLSHNDFLILETIARYYALSAPMIHRLCFPQRKDQRHTRRRLAELARQKLVRKSPVNVAFSTGNSGPAYTPTQEGSEALAVYFNDDAWLATYSRPPRLDRLYHWLDCSWVHSIVDRACEQHAGVTLVRWINEWAPTLDTDGNPNGYVLHTQFREQPPLSCSPDAAFLLDIAGHRRVFYVEVDRGTSGPTRVAAAKTQGYDELRLTQTHRLHFPSTTFDDFNVLLITVDRNHRDRIQREVAKKTDRCPEQWLFADREDFSPETALFGDIYADHKANIGPLVKRSVLESIAEGLHDVA